MLMLMLMRKWERHKTNKRVCSSASASAYVAGVLICLCLRYAYAPVKSQSLTSLLQLVLPFFFLVIRENTASRIGENTKSNRHQKINSAFHLFHSVFIKSRPYHLRLISVSTAGWVKNCRKMQEEIKLYIVLMRPYQALTFLIQVICTGNLMPKKYIARNHDTLLILVQ